MKITQYKNDWRTRFAVTNEYTVLITSKNMFLNKMFHQCGRPMNAPTVDCTNNHKSTLWHNMFLHYRLSSRMGNGDSPLLQMNINMVGNNKICT